MTARHILDLLARGSRTHQSLATALGSAFEAGMRRQQQIQLVTMGPGYNTDDHATTQLAKIECDPQDSRHGPSRILEGLAVYLQRTIKDARVGTVQFSFFYRGTEESAWAPLRWTNVAVGPAPLRDFVEPPPDDPVPDENFENADAEGEDDVDPDDMDPDESADHEMRRPARQHESFAEVDSRELMHRAEVGTHIEQIRGQETQRWNEGSTVVRMGLAMCEMMRVNTEALRAIGDRDIFYRDITTRSMNNSETMGQRALDAALASPPGVSPPASGDGEPTRFKQGLSLASLVIDMIARGGQPPAPRRRRLSSGAANAQARGEIVTRSGAPGEVPLPDDSAWGGYDNVAKPPPGVARFLAGGPPGGDLVAGASGPPARVEQPLEQRRTAPEGQRQPTREELRRFLLEADPEDLRDIVPDVVERVAPAHAGLVQRLLETTDVGSDDDEEDTELPE